MKLKFSIAFSLLSIESCETNAKETEYEKKQRIHIENRNSENLKKTKEYVETTKYFFKTFKQMGLTDEDIYNIVKLGVDKGWNEKAFSKKITRSLERLKHIAFIYGNLLKTLLKKPEIVINENEFSKEQVATIMNRFWQRMEEEYFLKKNTRIVIKNFIEAIGGNTKFLKEKFSNINLLEVTFLKNFDAIVELGGENLYDWIEGSS